MKCNKCKVKLVKEEYQSKIANSISAGALLLLVLFTLYDWFFLRKYPPSDLSEIYAFGMITFLLGLLFAAVIFNNFIPRARVGNKEGESELLRKVSPGKFKLVRPIKYGL